jgi:hypothetical protein
MTKSQWVAGVAICGALAVLIGGAAFVFVKPHHNAQNTASTRATVAIEAATAPASTARVSQPKEQVAHVAAVTEMATAPNHVPATVAVSQPKPEVEVAKVQPTYLAQQSLALTSPAPARPQAPVEVTPPVVPPSQIILASVEPTQQRPKSSAPSLVSPASVAVAKPSEPVVERVNVSAVRRQAVAHVNIDAIGRGNSLTIQLPKKP